jgi:hypothetical protein
VALVPAVGLALAAALVLALALALVLALILALVLVVLELVVWCWCAGWALGLGSTGGVRARPRIRKGHDSTQCPRRGATATSVLSGAQSS